MARKWYLLLVALFVFLGACSAPIYIPQNSVGSDALQAARRIIYVSPDGNNQSSGTRGIPLATIHKAIEIAQPGDVIKVAPGTYNENINLRSKISLIGSGADVTILTADSGNIVTAKNVSGVTVEGFTIDGQDACSSGFFCDQCHRSRDAVILRGNRIVNINGHGIQYMYSSGIIENNTVIITTRAGIYCEVVNAPWYPRVIGNTISQTDTGIVLMNHIRSVVQENTISDVSESGIVCSHGCTAVIEDNAILNVGESGIRCYFGSRPVIRSNRIQFCGKNGVSCIDSSYPKLRKNVIIQNRQYGVYIEADCLPDLGREDDRGFNEIYGNTMYDIYNLAPRSAKAIGNWWGSSSPNPEQFYGNVDYSMALKHEGGDIIEPSDLREGETTQGVGESRIVTTAIGGGFSLRIAGEGLMPGRGANLHVGIAAPELLLQASAEYFDGGSYTLKSGEANATVLAKGEELQPYFGAGIGYYLPEYSFDSYSNSIEIKSSFGWNLHAGVNIKVNQKTTINMGLKSLFLDMNVTTEKSKEQFGGLSATIGFIYALSARSPQAPEDIQRNIFR